MPGGFWPPSRNGNVFGSSARPSTIRRRRSLLGRKNRSDNDLPQQDQEKQQQHQMRQPQPPLQQIPAQIPQQIAQRPVTAYVLPENVKTILIAGTPECWNLSTSAEAFIPEACDASLLTLGSELTPATIDEEVPYHGSPRSQQHGSVEWLRSGNPASPTSSRRKRKQQQQKPHVCGTIEDGRSKEADSMALMYQNPSSGRPVSPQQALHVWLHSMDNVIKSQEMAALVMSTRDVVKVAGGIAVKTAFLPVTLPLHVACATRDFVEWTLHQALAQTGAILDHPHGRERRRLTLKDGPSDEEDKGASSSLERSRGKEECDNPLVGLLKLVPVVLQTAGKVKDEIGSAVIGILSPPQPQRMNDDVVSDKDLFDRLKIPVVGPEGILVVPAEEEPSSCQKVPASAAPLPPKVIEPLAELKLPTAISPTEALATKADFSKYLLRVEDLGVTAPGHEDAILLYIDLGAEFREAASFKPCLERLATRAIELATSHAPSIPPAKTPDNLDVEWKPEGSTAKILRKKARQTPERWEETQRTEVMMWSGNFKKSKGGSDIHRQYSLFLARGIVDRLSPREFLELLWDNNRTEEYNNFCMGRKDAVQIEDEVLSSKDVHTGVKVVRSETRVPFTGLSVSLCTMMHCRALPGGPEEGYYIISRSLVSGMAGSHTSVSGASDVQKSKSEILWGVNVLRAVPGCPGQTELTSLSQVASTMVPKFLSQRIGIMGVEDFFRNVRNTPKVTTTPTAASSNDNTLPKVPQTQSCASF